MISRNPPDARQFSDRNAHDAKAETSNAKAFTPNKNAAKRAGVKPTELARLRALAKLEGQPLEATSQIKGATRTDVRHAKEAHRQQAAAKLVAAPQTLLAPKAAKVAAQTSAKRDRAQSTSADSSSSDLVHGPLAALERAVKAFAEEQAHAQRKARR